MIRKPIKWEDPETGEEHIDIHSFHLSKQEIIKLHATTAGGLGGIFRNATDSNDEGVAVMGLRDLILMSYGVREEDGKGFKKTPELRKQFEDSFAFDALFCEVLEDPEVAGVEFFKGVVPRGMAVNVSIEDIKTAAETGDITKVLPPPPKG